MIKLTKELRETIMSQGGQIFTDPEDGREKVSFMGQVIDPMLDVDNIDYESIDLDDDDEDEVDDGSSSSYSSTDGTFQLDDVAGGTQETDGSSIETEYCEIAIGEAFRLCSRNSPDGHNPDKCTFYAAAKLLGFTPSELQDLGDLDEEADNFAVESVDLGDFEEIRRAVALLAWKNFTVGGQTIMDSFQSAWAVIKEV